MSHCIKIYRTFHQPDGEVEHKIAEINIQQVPDDLEELVWAMGGDRHEVENQTDTR